MRIIAGKNKGRRLAAVGKGDEAAHLRPTTDRVRETLFNILAGGRFGDVITGARVLDMFAGTGALGLEALSRGATHASFLETGRKATAILTENIRICGAADQCSVQKRDATRLAACPTAPFDLVFLDPPYSKALGEKAVQTALDGDWIAENGVVVWEEAASVSVPAAFDILDERAMGGTNVTFLRRIG